MILKSNFPGIRPSIVKRVATAQEPDPGFCGSPDKASVAVAPWFTVVLFLAAVMVGASLIYKFIGPSI